MSRKLEKIARQYRIDPATLPLVNENSMTVNVSSTVVTPTEESQQSTLEGLKAEAQEAMRRLKEFQRAERDRILASRK